MPRSLRFGRFVLKYGIIGLVIVVVYANTTIPSEAGDWIYTDPGALPRNRVGLILGTSHYLTSGEPNPYFEHRIAAATRLYELGKIDFVLASGDNAHPSYNEPQRMKEALTARGIASDAIFLDYAGFSTLDSVIRTHEVFGQDSFTIITQGFHAARAIYIARYRGMDAVAYTAENVTGPVGLNTTIREYFARVKALIDVHILRTQPRFLGERIWIY
ncbi:MAG: vancomycin high temperature exclusion protein [Spirochaetaceae bacterium]